MRLNKILSNLSIPTDFRKLIYDRKIKQIGSLYSSMILGIIFGIIVSVANTRLLGPESFGDFKFIQSVYSFFSIILAFGLLVTVSKLLAERKNDSIRKELIGSSLVILSVLGIIFIITIFIFSLIQEKIFTTDLSNILVMLLPFFFFIPFLQGMENIYQGENRIYEMSVLRIAPQVIYIIVLVAFYKTGNINLQNALIIQLSAITVVILYSAYSLRPSFKNLTSNVKYILKENKSYGFNVYLGSVIGVASTQLAPLAISVFSKNNIDVGFYSLAYTITMPLAFIPTVVGTTMFKEFANRNSVSKRSTKATIMISLFSLLVFVLMVKPMIIILYSKDFLTVVDLAYIVAVGQVFHGFGNYYNRFLGSKGQGKFLRNGAFCVGAANIVGFIVLIPYWGALGAALTKLVSGFVYIGSMLYYYKLYIIHEKN